MNVVEYEGDHRVLVHCDKCGFRRWLDNPTTAQWMAVRCPCSAASSGQGDAQDA